MIKTALIGLGKMGISHLAILQAHPDIDLIAVCDPSGFILDGISKFTKLKTYSDYQKLLEGEALDAVVVATPSKFHADIVRTALNKDLHVFCEKPFTLSVQEGLELAQLAEDKKLVNQVGYHYRFVGAFQEAKRLLDAGVIGKVHHIRAEANGPVVLRAKGATWRSAKSEGGGCLYDYASHVIDLLNYLVGPPSSVSGSVLNKIFSTGVDDEVYSTFRYDNGASVQLAANWSDESFRKMSVKITISGKAGRIVADRQEVQIYLRDGEIAATNGLNKGWNVRYTTDLTEEVWYYLRGEEYSAQIAHFAKLINEGGTENLSTFRSACQTDKIIADIAENAATGKDVGNGAAVRVGGDGRSLLQSVFSFGRRSAHG